MMKKRAVLAISLLAAGISVVSANSAPSNDAFFPWTVGDHWTYKTTNKGKHEVFTMNVAVAATWEDGGKSGIVLTQKDKRGQMRQFMLRNADGVFIQKLGLKKSYTPEVFTRFNPPVPAVIYPLTPGTHVHWEGRLKVAMIDKPIIFDGEVVSWEDVDVPAGHFHCIKLHYHEKRGDDVVDEDAWYAANVGQVKYDGGQYTKELTAYDVRP